jgi:superfamily II DNA or RNA helicase
LLRALTVFKGLDLPGIEIVVQWRYTQSLCTLWQRLGRAARDPRREATSIYLVEPQYMDQTSKQSDQGDSGPTERVQQKRSQGVANPGGPSRKRGQLQGREGHGGRKKSRVDQAQPHASEAQTDGKLIVKEDRHQHYEVAAMDTYVNARERGTCRHMVSNEFFGNRPGECLCTDG